MDFRKNPKYNIKRFVLQVSGDFIWKFWGWIKEKD